MYGYEVAQWVKEATILQGFTCMEAAASHSLTALYRYSLHSTKCKSYNPILSKDMGTPSDLAP